MDLIERDSGEILWIEDELPVKYRPIPTREPDLSEPSDPSTWYQWHLYNTRADEAWKLGYSGKGQRISILDSGTNKHSKDLGHLDFANSWNFVTKEKDPTPPEKLCQAGQDDCSHGTTCANLALGESNDFCGVGIAPASSLQGFLVLEPTDAPWVTNREFAEALSHPTDISSNSYGYWSCVWDRLLGIECDLTKLSKTERSAIEQTTSSGRDGKGTIILFAAGNDGHLFEDTNIQETLTLRQVFAIGASTSKYEPTQWSCPGAGLMITAPGSSLFGTTVKITNTGRREICGEIGSGTSWAAPITSGAIALLLEANDALTWRDVQHILVRSSFRQPSIDWVTNAGGRKFSYHSGFGNLDILSALTLALNWTSFPQERSIFGTNSSQIVVNKTEEVKIEIQEDLVVESVNLVLDISVRRRGGLEIVLISPSGTKHTILKARPDSDRNYNQWQPLARGFWDERSKGVWTVQITKKSKHRSPGRTTINSISLKIYGTVPGEYPKNPEIAGGIEAPFLVARQVSSNEVIIFLNEMGQQVEANELQIRSVHGDWISVETSPSHRMKAKNLNPNSIYLFRGRSQVGTHWSDWSRVLSVKTNR